MLTTEQEKLIELFNEQTVEIYKKWLKVDGLTSSSSFRLDDVFRKLYTKLAPEEPVLPPSWSYRLTVISQRGDGIQGTGDVLWMPDGWEKRTFELLVADKAYVVTKESDSEPEDHLWVFTVYAPTAAALELAVEELSQLLPPMPEIKTQVKSNSKKEEQVIEKIEEHPKVVDPKLFMSIVPAIGFFLFSIKEHLEKIQGITNLENNYLYNLAECYCEYDELHFDFKNYHFSVYENNEGDEDVWNFYVKAECPEDIISEIVEYCKLFGRRVK